MPRTKTPAKKKTDKKEEPAAAPAHPGALSTAYAHWVRLTRLALHGAEIGGTETVLINPANVTWVEPTPPVPIAGGSVAPSVGATLHIVGQPLLPVPVLESVEEVYQAFSTRST